MSTRPLISALQRLAPGRAARVLPGWMVACQAWAAAWFPSRATRVVALLVALWALNLLDLGYTLVESGQRHFVELNPLASQLLDQSFWLAAYKLVLVALGTAILLFARRHFLAEACCWLSCVMYSFVLSRWLAYFSDLSDSLSDPAVVLG